MSRLEGFDSKFVSADDRITNALAVDEERKVLEETDDYRINSNLFYSTLCASSVADR